MTEDKSFVIVEFRFSSILEGGLVAFLVKRLGDRR
jgi:hypothetical protein